MEHGLHTLHFLLEKLQHIAVRFAVVDDDGQIELLGQINLLQKDALLHLLGLVFLPVVIKADFANGHYLGVHGPSSQLLQIIGRNAL